MKRYNKYDLEYKQKELKYNLSKKHFNIYQDTTNYQFYNMKIVESGNYIDLYFYKKTKYKKISNDLKYHDLKLKNYNLSYDNITYYPTIIFTDKKYKLVKLKKTKYKSKTKELKYDNVIRTIYNFRNIVKANEDIFKSFITLTFKDNIIDLSVAQLKFKNYIRQVKRYIKNNYIDFELKYVAVPEFQKNGRVHFHLLTNLELDSPLIPKRSLKKTYSKDKTIKELYYYDLPFWIYGYSLALNIDFIDDITKYMIMYLVKDKDNRYYGYRKYYCSTNLKKPSVVFFNGNDQDSLSLVNLIDYNKVYERVYTDNKYLNKQLKQVLQTYDPIDINNFYNTYNGQVIHYQEFRKEK